jgi:hypothetical protein
MMTILSEVNRRKISVDEDRQDVVLVKSAARRSGRIRSERAEPGQQLPGHGF